MPASGEWGSACSAACGWCGACTSGPKVVGHCQRCEGPYFTPENTISGLCDLCLDRDQEIARIDREQQMKREQK